LHDIRYKIDAMFGTYLGGGGVSKSFPSSMDITGLQVPTRNLRDVCLFHVCPPCPRDVPLRQIQLVVILMSSECKLPHSSLV
jgi:hypothetical protein